MAVIGSPRSCTPVRAFQIAIRGSSGAGDIVVVLSNRCFKKSAATGGAVVGAKVASFTVVEVVGALGFDKNCVNYLKVLTAAQGAAQKMTTHAEADSEVAGLKGRFDAVKAIADTWVKKCDVLVKEWVLLDNTVTELNSWVAKDKSAEGENQFSLEKMESTLGELKNIFKQKEKLVEGL